VSGLGLRPALVVVTEREAEEAMARGMSCYDVIVDAVNRALGEVPSVPAASVRAKPPGMLPIEVTKVNGLTGERLVRQVFVPLSLLFPSWPHH
jgi:hypothetical protein